jgi:hypothetical protein
MIDHTTRLVIPISDFFQNGTMQNPEVPNEAGFREVKLIRTFVRNQNILELVWTICDKVHNQIVAVIERHPSFSIGFLHVVRRSPSMTSLIITSFAKLTVVDDRSHHPSGDSNF